MALQLPDEWRPHMEAIISSPGMTVVVGGVDTGKTSFCTMLANQGVEAGVPTAVVDGDMGQSEIGPPTTVGLALMDSPVRALNESVPHSLYFVGATSPVGHLLAVVAGAKTLAEKAEALGRRLVIVDTTGLVRGAIGRRLKTHKIELLSPRYIVALQRAGEAEHFLRLFDTWEDCTVYRLPLAPGIVPKSPALRTQRRAARFSEYFREGRECQLSLDKLATSGTWLRTGSRLGPRFLEPAEGALGMPVLYGESIDQGVYLVTAGEHDGRGTETLQEYFRTRNLVIVPASRYQHLIVSLLDSSLEVLSLGIVQGIDFRARAISLFTPLRSIAPVRSIRFGVLKLRPDGVEIGRLRPGEV